MNIKEEFSNEGLIYNRYLGENIELPFSFNDISVQPNDTVSADLINLKFDHLYDNFLYLYKNTLIASNIIPVSSTAIAGVTGASTEFSWYYNLSSRQFKPLAQSPGMEGADNTQTSLLIKNIDIDRYSLFISNGTEIKVLNFNDAASYINIAFSQTEVDAGYGVRYKNVCDMEVYNNFVFVLDSGLDTIVKYDASGFVGENTVTNNRLFYVNSIGNTGNFQAKTAFNNPLGMTVTDNLLYVLDSGNSSIKVFDTNLNWRQTYRLYTDFVSAFPVDIGSDNSSNIYVLTENKFIFKYDNKFTTKVVYDLNSLLQKDEQVKKIVFSQSNTNIFYLVTNKNIFKKLVSSPQSTVGKYLLYLYKYDIPDEIIKAFASAPTPGGDSDRNILFSVSGNVGKFGNFYDNLNLFDVLAVNNFDIYGSKEIQFNRNEYLQSWVFNKNISKLIINHMRLRDEIIGKFIASLDYKGNLAFKGTRYLLPDEIDSIYFEQDITFFIGANELLTSNIINRSLYKLFIIQQSLLNVLKAETVRIPVGTAPIKLN